MNNKRILKKILIYTLLTVMLLPNLFSLNTASAYAETTEKTDAIAIENHPAITFDDGADTQISDDVKGKLTNQEFYSLYENMSNVTYGYIDENGQDVEVSQNKLQSRANLDMTEWTDYDFRVESNGSYIQGKVPVMKIDGEVVFCIEPGVIAHEGDGYNPTQLPSNIQKRIVDIGAFGYPMMPSHESYVATQGYMWEAMGASFTTSYAGYGAMKAQIDQNIDHYYTRPSFNGQTITIKANQTVTLEDTNNVLSEYIADQSTGNLSVSKNGNTLSITATANSNEKSKVEMWKASAVGTSIAYVKAGSQAVAKFAIEDLAPFTVNVDVKKSGKIQIVKTDDETGRPLGNIQFKMTGFVDGQLKEATYTTDANGNAVSMDFDFDTEATVVEVATLTGYILDATPHKVKIIAGETVKVPLTNKIQKGRFKGHKEKEYFNSEKTEDQGTPVYDVFPVENIMFDVVALTDITMPDKTTVVYPKGSVVDTVKTDAKGNFASNVDLYIGEQNQYQLVEKNVPANYRKPSDVQTTFSIPYGKSTEKVIVYDLKTIDNLLKTGEWDLNKVNELTGKNIAGATFYIKGISRYNKDVQYKFTTEEAKTTIAKLIAGDYQVIEVEFPDGFTQSNGESETKIISIKDAETTTTTWRNTKIPAKVGTKATGINGEKAFDPAIENTIIDKIAYEGFEKDKEYTRVTQLVDAKTGEVVVSQEDQVTFEQSKGTDTVEMTIPANTIKTGGEYVFFEYYYADKEKEELTAEHKDINDKDQTVLFVEKQVGTKATGINGEKAFDPAVENKVIDEVAYEGFKTNKEYTRVTQLVDAKTGEVVVSQEDQVTFEKSKGTDTVEMTIPANTIKANGDYVFFEYYYTDKEKEELYAGHADIDDKNQTITFVEKQVGTKATGINGQKAFDPTVENTIIDQIFYEGFETNKEYIRVTQLVNVKTGEVVVTQEDKVTFEQSKGTDKVEMVIPANTITSDGEYVFFEEYYKTPEKEELYAGHKDINDKDQTVTFKTNRFVEQLKGFLPTTGEQVMQTMVVGGLFLILGIAYFVFKKRTVNHSK